METRNITIVTTTNQRKHVVNTNATTLGELKDALRENGIYYYGMTFYEGISHTELLTDESILPHDVPYKGETTNNLVFMLTVPNKKIKSGGILPEARAALYDTIRELNLEDVCLKKFGKNFTMCKNSELMQVIEDAQAANESTGEGDVVALQKAFVALVDLLVDESYLGEHDGDCLKAIVYDTSAPESAKSPYSDTEIDDMFNFLS